ncbi:amidohydrolase [Paraglaciecola sp.]|uniref:amidohydrolase n=1 Tax=Paraglaciecola sp. TaxID=1920173 RepID=UPI0030F41DD9
MKENLNLALCQCSPVWEDANANHKMFEKHIASVGGNVDVVVLPEMFTTGFTMDPVKIAQPMSGKTVSWMNEQATKHNVTIVGSVVIKDDGNFYNRMIWARPNTPPLHYDKKHLFTFAGEDRFYSAGNKQLIVEIAGWKLASFVCFDLRFPVWCRNSNQNTYDVGLFIASWPKVRSQQWNTLLRARAIENQAYVVAVNRVGKDGNNIDYNGDSQLIDTLGNVLVHEMETENIKVVTLNKTHLQNTRSQFPFLKEADPYLLVGSPVNDAFKNAS